ncbi:hypothetical protein [Streptomyces sp. NPDC056401]|uniref:hypothetical protein n=1 Tax=Streptomyces sp. NPDC056401 TaxID=3345809 RepID=UPI0035DA003A
MSRLAEVIVLAPSAVEVMEPLTRPDDSREWGGCFERLYQVDGWVKEFNRSRSGLFRCLESLAWPNPASVQVLIHDEEDDCFGLWMIQDGVLTEVQLPGHTRLHRPAPTSEGSPPEPGMLWRTQTVVPPGFSTERQDPRPAW